MATLLSLDMAGIPGLSSALRTVGDFERHRKTMAFLVHGKMKEQVRRTFDRQADPETGQAWLPVQPFGHGADPTHKILQSNAGAGLMGSIMAANLDMDGDLVLLGPPDSIPYANAHQWGVTIRPKNAKYLTLPMGRDVALAGSARRWWEQQKSANKKPFIYKAKTGKKNLFIAIPEDGKLKLAWLLLEEVTIPQRRFFGWNDEYSNEIGTICKARLAVIARNAGLDVKGGTA